jgi:hypothetical protein
MICFLAFSVEYFNIFCYDNRWGNLSEAAHPPLEGKKKPSRQKKGGMPMFVTYADLIQFVILLVALVGLCHQIFKDKED